MRKGIKLFACLCCCVFICAAAVACSPVNNDPKPSNNAENAEIAGFELPHASGLADVDYEYEYNANLFYRNEPRIMGADPGAIYVSDDDIKGSYEYFMDNYKYTDEDGSKKWIDGYDEERFIAENGSLQQWLDQYGNSYYMAVTQHGNASAETSKKYGSKMGAFRMFSTRDFVNWKECGVIDGFAINITKDAWCDNLFWAPEFIRDPETGLYFMFWGAATISGGAGHTYPTRESRLENNIRGTVAWSKNPLGPYELITASDYIRYMAGKDKNGNVLTGTKLLTDKVTGVKYYEVYGRDGKTVVGYRNGSSYYNLAGMSITMDTPIINSGYYYIRYCDSQSKKQEYRDVSRRRDCGSEENYVSEILDLNPMIDEKGDLYCYFTLGTGGGSKPGVYGIWVVKMLDFITPDWNTLRYIMKVGYTSVENDGTTLLGNPVGESYFNEGGVNEGTNVVYHDGRYYLTYSYFGYTDVRYSVGVAISDSPYGPFVKQYDYMPILGKGIERNNYKGGTGHHCFIYAGDEMFILYHCTDNPDNNYDNNNNYLGRHISVDRVFWKYVDDLGYDMMFANGATINLQPKPETFTGYTNVAKYATVTGNGDFGDVEYVNDGMFTAQPFSRIFEYGKEDGDLRVKLTWDEPVTVKAIMIYNSGSYYTAFNKVNSIKFTLAEKPAWYLSDKYNGYCYIKNLIVDERDCMRDDYLMRHGAAAIAEFNEIKITAMEFVISGNSEDKYSDFSEDLSIMENYRKVALSDVYVFGKNN